MTKATAAALASSGLASVVTDFDNLDAAAASETPYEFELKHPVTGSGLAVFISVVGPESADFKNRVRKEANNARLKAYQAQRKGKEVQPDTVEEGEAFSVDLMTLLVKGWRTVTGGTRNPEGELEGGESRPVIMWKGEALDFNSGNLIRWLLAFAWARKQVDEAAGDLANFLGN